MMTAEKQVADAIAELREIAAGYKAGAERWRQQRRKIIDIIVAHADIATLEAVLRHLENCCDDWKPWPPAQSQ
jgi:hypothetical protein